MPTRRERRSVAPRLAPVRARAPSGRGSRDPGQRPPARRRRRAAHRLPHRPAPAELRPAARAPGLAWVDTLLDGFVLALAESARGRGAGRRTAATLRELADTIVGSGARRIDHAHATRFLGFVDDHVRAGPPATIAFAIEPALVVALTPALVAGPAVAPTVLATALHALIDATLTRFLDAPLALLSLGMVARTAVRLGRGAVASRVHGELGRAVHDPAAAARLQARLVGYVGR